MVWEEEFFPRWQCIVSFSPHAMGWTVLRMLVEIPLASGQVAWSADQRRTSSLRDISSDRKSGGWLREEEYMEPRKGGHDSSQLSHDFEESAFFYAHAIRFSPELITLSH